MVAGSNPVIPTVKNEGVMLISVTPFSLFSTTFLKQWLLVCANKCNFVLSLFMFIR